MARDPQLRNCFLDAVPEDVRPQHRRILEENAFFYPEFVCAREDPTFFRKLREELDFAPAWLDNGMPFSRHICIGSDSVLASSPVFCEIIELLARTFHVEPVRSLVNLYRNGGDWCNLHSDQYDAGHCGINFTIGASFGEDRSLLFEEKVHDRRGAARGVADLQKVQISITQRNGDVHAFGEAVNEKWRHGVPRCPRAQGERISIMLWGYRGDGAVLPDRALSFSGSFPHLLRYDPKSSRAPRTCEACNQTKLQLGGKVDLDHRWCCSQCWEEHDAKGWLPSPAEDPQHVTDCLTIQGSQLAVAMLAGMKTIECRKTELPEGWYALHVARRPSDAPERRRVEEQWPNAPKEDELPHEAIVGLVLISRPEGKQPAEDCPWAAPGICYVICSVVALERTLPARPPGNPVEPWRLSPAAQRSVANLIEGQPIYENVKPKLVSAPKIAGARAIVSKNVSVEEPGQAVLEAGPETAIDAGNCSSGDAAGRSADTQQSSWWQAGDWGRGGDGTSWHNWSATPWNASTWQPADSSDAVASDWKSRWGAESSWYSSQQAGYENWREGHAANADSTNGPYEPTPSTASTAPASTLEPSPGARHDTSGEPGSSASLASTRSKTALDNRATDSRSGVSDRLASNHDATAEPPPGLGEPRRQQDAHAAPSPGVARDQGSPPARQPTDPSRPPPYAPPSLERQDQRPPPYAPPALDRNSRSQSAGGYQSGQHRSAEAKTVQARSGRAGPRGSATVQDANAAPRGDKNTATGNSDPWGGTGDPWTMALEQGRVPGKKSSTASANAAWKRYRG